MNTDRPWFSVDAVNTVLDEALANVSGVDTRQLAVRCVNAAFAALANDPDIARGHFLDGDDLLDLALLILKDPPG